LRAILSLVFRLALLAVATQQCAFSISRRKVIKRCWEQFFASPAWLLPLPTHHRPAGVLSLVTTLREHFQVFRPVISLVFVLVVHILGYKDRSFELHGRNPHVLVNVALLVRIRVVRQMQLPVVATIDPGRVRKVIPRATISECLAPV
jgi:hypothetical protein